MRHNGEQKRTKERHYRQFMMRTVFIYNRIELLTVHPDLM